jgi:aminopeptidase N
VAIGLYDRDGEALVRHRQIEVDVAGARTPVPALRGERLPALVIVNDEDLTFAKMRLDSHSRRTLREGLKRLEDPLARALCWSAAYEEMRDAVMPARDYLRLVLDHIAGEEEIGLVQSLIANCSAAMSVYGDPTRAERARLDFATAARRALERAAPGSDFQLAWAHAFIATARSPEHVAALEALLDGGTPVPGLAIDTDLRWQIVHSLAAGGSLGDERIAAELERDSTDSGQRRAAAARAAIPTAEAKAAAWQAILSDGDLPLAMRKAWMGGFMRHDQAVLLAPYGGKYFAALPAVWTEHDVEVAMSFARAMYPTPWMGQELLKMTDQFLVSAQPPPAVRRYLLEGADDVRRALRARALDAGAGSA